MLTERNYKRVKEEKEKEEEKDKKEKIVVVVMGTPWVTDSLSSMSRSCTTD